jgi:hypothetical protein
MPSEMKEYWLTGSVEGVPDLLLPVAHAFLQARQDVEHLISDLPRELLWTRPGAAASVGFHLLHLAGSVDRLLTYARGDTLTPAQREALALERAGGDPNVGADVLLGIVMHCLDSALQQVRHTDPSTLVHERRIGKAQLPTTVHGLLFHAAEHCTRHVGQITTTLKILRGMPTYLG